MNDSFANIEPIKRSNSMFLHPSPDIDIKVIKQIGDYSLGVELGSGAFGKVVLGKHILTNELVAIKILDKMILSSTPDDYQSVKQEINILKSVKHKHIVQLYEVLQTSRHIFIIMEYCEGKDLLDYILTKSKLSEEESLKYFHQLINALFYLHSQNIAHRDIKIDNMLLDRNRDLKLVDFGLSTKYPDDNLLDQPCGTVVYAAPEVLQGREYHGMLADVWSSGIVLYGMLSGYLPFGEPDDEINRQNIIMGKIKFPTYFSDCVKDLLMHMLDLDPMTRYTLQEVRSHPWFNLIDYKLIPGIIIGYNIIPVDEKILSLCVTYNCDKEKVRESVINNKYNSDSALYYLLIKKLQKKGFQSVSDFCSDEFINFVLDDNNLVEVKDNERNNIQESEIKYNININANNNCSAPPDGKQRYKEQKNENKENIENKDLVTPKNSFNENINRKIDFEETSKGVLSFIINTPSFQGTNNELFNINTSNSINNKLNKDKTNNDNDSKKTNKNTSSDSKQKNIVFQPVTVNDFQIIEEGHKEMPEPKLLNNFELDNKATTNNIFIDENIQTSTPNESQNEKDYNLLNVVFKNSEDNNDKTSIEKKSEKKINIIKNIFESHIKDINNINISYNNTSRNIRSNKNNKKPVDNSIEIMYNTSQEIKLRNNNDILETPPLSNKKTNNPNDNTSGELIGLNKEKVNNKEFIIETPPNNKAKYKEGYSNNTNKTNIIEDKNKSRNKNTLTKQKAYIDKNMTLSNKNKKEDKTKIDVNKIKDIRKINLFQDEVVEEDNNKKGKEIEKQPIVLSQITERELNYRTNTEVYTSYNNEAFHTMPNNEDKIDHLISTEPNEVSQLKQSIDINNVNEKIDPIKEVKKDEDIIVKMTPVKETKKDEDIIVKMTPIKETKKEKDIIVKITPIKETKKDEDIIVKVTPVKETKKDEDIIVKVTPIKETKKDEDIIVKVAQKKENPKGDIITIPITIKHQKDVNDKSLNNDINKDKEINIDINSKEQKSEAINDKINQEIEKQQKNNEININDNNKKEIKPEKGKNIEEKVNQIVKPKKGNKNIKAKKKKNIKIKNDVKTKKNPMINSIIKNYKSIIDNSKNMEDINNNKKSISKEKIKKNNINYSSKNKIGKNSLEEIFSIKVIMNKNLFSKDKSKNNNIKNKTEKQNRKIKSIYRVNLGCNNISKGKNTTINKKPTVSIFQNKLVKNYYINKKNVIKSGKITYSSHVKSSSIHVLGTLAKNDRYNKKKMNTSSTNSNSLFKMNNLTKSKNKPIMTSKGSNKMRNSIQNNFLIKSYNNKYLQLFKSTQYKNNNLLFSNKIDKTNLNKKFDEIAHKINKNSKTKIKKYEDKKVPLWKYIQSDQYLNHNNSKNKKASLHKDKNEMKKRPNKILDISKNIRNKLIHKNSYQNRTIDNINQNKQLNLTNLTNINNISKHFSSSKDKNINVFFINIKNFISNKQENNTKKANKKYFDSSLNSQKYKSPFEVRELSESIKNKNLNQKTRQAKIPWKIKKKAIDEKLEIDKLYKYYLRKCKSPLKKNSKRINQKLYNIKPIVNNNLKNNKLKDNHSLFYYSNAKIAKYNFNKMKNSGGDIHKNKKLMTSSRKNDISKSSNTKFSHIFSQKCNSTYKKTYNSSLKSISLNQRSIYPHNLFKSTKNYYGIKSSNNKLLKNYSVVMDLSCLFMKFENLDECYQSLVDKLIKKNIYFIQKSNKVLRCFKNGKCCEIEIVKLSQAINKNDDKNKKNLYCYKIIKKNRGQINKIFKNLLLE